MTKIKMPEQCETQEDYLERCRQNHAVLGAIPQDMAVRKVRIELRNVSFDCDVEFIKTCVAILANGHQEQPQAPVAPVKFDPNW